MNLLEQQHKAYLTNVERVKKALALSILEIEKDFADSGSLPFDAMEETTLAQRGKIRVLLQALRALLKAVLMAKRNPDSTRHAQSLNREVDTVIELFALLNESLD